MNHNQAKFSPINARVLLALKSAAVLGIAVATLGIVYSLDTIRRTQTPPTQTAGTPLAGQYRFQVGTPGPGTMAPNVRLASSDGSEFNLAALRGKTVLLFFQEGIMCPACWDQIRDIEANFAQFQALGIDQMVSISTDSLDVLKQKDAIDHYQTPLLSDPNLAVSHTYTTNQYGMMGDHMNGHSFILVGPDGQILWRADYGGAPDYTMFVPTRNLIADMQQGLNRVQ
mgnify:CR=1 FL=1